MNPCELNAVITAITNYLYSNLSKKDFYCLNIFLSELSKSMFSMTLLQDVCFRHGRHVSASLAVAVSEEGEDGEEGEAAAAAGS